MVRNPTFKDDRKTAALKATQSWMKTNQLLVTAAISLLIGFLLARL